MNDSNKPPNSPGDSPSDDSRNPNDENLDQEPEDHPVEGKDSEKSDSSDPEGEEKAGSEAAVPRSTQPPQGPIQRAKSSRQDPDDDDSEDDEEEKELGGRMSFLEHLDELRKRILYSVIASVVAFAACWGFREVIYDFIAAPIYLIVDSLKVIRPTEPFTIYLKVSFVAAIFLASPFILLQVWFFVAPGLYRKEKSYALPFLFGSTVLFVLGGAFAYYVVLPPALNFLLVDFGKRFEALITAVEYFDFALLIIVGMGAIFQLPVLVAFLSLFGLVTPRFLWKNFRYAFLIITIIAAVLSPTTDPFNLFLWSGPMVILYIFSVGVSWIFQRRRNKKEQELFTRK